MKYKKIQLTSCAFAAFLIFGFAIEAESATIYTDRAAFIAMLRPGYYLEDFQSTDPPTYSANGFSYTVSGDIIYDSGSFIGNNNPNTSLIITFTSGNVTAVGGEFFITNVR